MGGVWKQEVQAALLRNVAARGELEQQFLLRSPGLLPAGSWGCRAGRAPSVGSDLGRQEGDAWPTLDIPPQAVVGSFPGPETQLK